MEELLKKFSPAKITLSDGSEDMLAAAGKKLSMHSNIEYIRASFQEIIQSDIFHEKYDFIYSSYAIHHLPQAEKKLLYSKIYTLLNPEGCFVHNDVVAPASNKMEGWYLELWREWIRQFPNKEEVQKLENIPDRYSKSPDDFADPLDIHLDF